MHSSCALIHHPHKHCWDSPTGQILDPSMHILILLLQFYLFNDSLYRLVLPSRLAWRGRGGPSPLVDLGVDWVILLGAWGSFGPGDRLGTAGIHACTGSMGNGTSPRSRSNRPGLIGDDCGGREAPAWCSNAHRGGSLSRQVTGPSVPLPEVEPGHIRLACGRRPCTAGRFFHQCPAVPGR